MTVADALQLPVLKGARVLTLAQTLPDKPITWVSVMEVPVEGFIRPGEFVMSTGMNIGNDHALLSQFIKDVSKANPAALAIAIGPYTPAIPQRVVREASRQRLALIEIPWKVRFSEISEAILKRLMREQMASRSLDEFVWSLATGSSTEEDAVARGQQFGYRPRTRYVAVLGRVTSARKGQSGEDHNTEARLVREICDKHAQNSGMHWLGTAAGESIIGFLEIGSNKQRAHTWLTTVNAHLKTTCSVSWGIGRPCKGFADMQSSYQDAAVACDIGRGTHGNGTVTDVADVLGDRVLLKLKHDSDAAMLAQRYIHPLRGGGRMQLVETLETYFENDRNASETARALGISRQALLYRLNKSQALLDCDFNSPQQRFAIALGLRLNKLNRHSRSSD